MPASNPTQGDRHVNRPLTNISLAYAQSTDGFIADKVFPNIPVRKQSDRYWRYCRADFNRDEMEERAAGTETAGGGYNIDSTPTYYAPVYGYHTDIDDQSRDNEDEPLNADADATEFVTWKALLKRERTWAQKYFGPGVWANGLLGVDAAPAAGTQFLKWNDTGSTPIEDIRSAKRAILGTTGIKPNKIVLAKSVYDALVDHPDIVDRVKYGQTPGKPAMANQSTLAQLFELDEVMVAEAVVNTGAKGRNYADSMDREVSQFVMGDHALLVYANPNPGLRKPSAGYTFSWTGRVGNSPMGHRIKQFRMEQLESDRIEVQQAYDQKVVADDLGFLFENAIYNPAS